MNRSFYLGAVPIRAPNLRYPKLPRDWIKWAIDVGPLGPGRAMAPPLFLDGVSNVNRLKHFGINVRPSMKPLLSRYFSNRLLF